MNQSDAKKDDADYLLDLLDMLESFKFPEEEEIRA